MTTIYCCGREVNGLVCTPNSRCEDCAAQDPTAAKTAFRAVESLGRRLEETLQQRNDLRDSLLSVLASAPVQGRSFLVMNPPHGCPARVPWRIVAPHEPQAIRNHDQTLERLNERGGLDPSELLAVLDDRRWKSMPPAHAAVALTSTVAKLVARQARTSAAAEEMADVLRAVRTALPDRELRLVEGVLAKIDRADAIAKETP